MSKLSASPNIAVVNHPYYTDDYGGCLFPRELSADDPVGNTSIPASRLLELVKVTPPAVHGRWGGAEAFGFNPY